MGGFAVRAAASMPGRRAPRYGKPSLQKQARDRRRAIELGLIADEAPKTREELQQEREAAQIRAEERSETRRLGAEKRAEERQARRDAARTAAEIQKERLKQQEKLTEVNKRRALVGLPPVQTETPGPVSVPVTPGAGGSGKQEPLTLLPKSVTGLTARPKTQLDPDLQQAVAEGLMTLTAAQYRQSARRKEVQAQKKAEEKALGEQAEERVKREQLHSQLFEAIEFSAPGMDPAEKDKLLRSAIKQKMTPTQVRSYVTAQADKARKAEESARKKRVATKAKSNADRLLSYRHDPALFKETLMDLVAALQQPGISEEDRMELEATIKEAEKRWGPISRLSVPAVRTPGLKGPEPTKKKPRAQHPMPKKPER